ncbi:MAG: hypothetical protein JO018_04465 [Candidatus Eremiobacteraeota bacterium]|nr:hypothetical protein [Candidatus Eremiobacteraeota bacterium]MBV9402966.1 hypothetical protein [Candidatus Eremiobacteraeota bacterium]MBV9972641.1 hypothetical protein [Candidatus Eremiobacteraeota bacterium]
MPYDQLIKYLHSLQGSTEKQYQLETEVADLIVGAGKAAGFDFAAADIRQALEHYNVKPYFWPGEGKE